MPVLFFELKNCKNNSKAISPANTKKAPKTKRQTERVKLGYFFCDRFFFDALTVAYFLKTVFLSNGPIVPYNVDHGSAKSFGKTKDWVNAVSLANSLQTPSGKSWIWTSDFSFESVMKMLPC